MKNQSLGSLVTIAVVLGLGVIILCQIGKNLVVNNEDELWDDPPAVEELEMPAEINTYQDALRASEVSEKPVLLFFRSSDSRWSNRMEEDIFSDSDVEKLLDDYIVYHVDINKEQEVATQYGVKRVPAFVVIDYEENIKKSTKGYKRKKAFISWLEEKPSTWKNLRPNWW